MTKDTDKTDGAQPITGERLDEIEALSEAANIQTKSTYNGDLWLMSAFGVTWSSAVDRGMYTSDGFIRKCREMLASQSQIMGLIEQDVPDLVAEVRRLRAKLEGDQ